MSIEKVTSHNRPIITDFIINHWYTKEIIIRGKVIDMTQVDGFIMMEKNVVVGLITYRIYNDILEIVSLDSLCEGQGNGTKLIDQVMQEAKERKCKKIILITTNDNINALRFYQKRGFDMTHLYHNSLEVSRKLKPEIPLIGDNDIPLRHEIQLELTVS